MTDKPSERSDESEAIYFGQVATIRLKPLMDHDYSRKYKCNPETGLFVHVSETDQTDPLTRTESEEV